MSCKIANFVSKALAAEVAAADLTFDLDNSDDLPVLTAADYFYAVLVRSSDNAREIIKVTDVTGQTITCERAKESTVALIFEAGDAFQLWVTAQTLYDISAFPALTVEVTGGSLAKVVECQVSVAGYFKVRCWLVDSATPAEQQTLIPPSGSDLVHWERLTDSAGYVEFPVSHTEAERTWYACVEVCGQVVISTAITMGV